MNVLSFDTSSIVATCAIINDEKLVCEYIINNKKNHSEKLLPLISQMLKDSQMSFDDIDGIAIAQGPGSFTGLRIGAATAKGLAYALDLPVLGVPTLDGLSYNVRHFNGLICPVLNARRNQVYTAVYRGGNEKIPERITNFMAVSVEKVLDHIEQLEEKSIFLGDGLDVFKEDIKNRLKDNAVFCSPADRMPMASSIGIIGAEKLKQNKGQTAFEFEPLYIRKSQAQIQYEKKKGK